MTVELVVGPYDSHDEACEVRDALGASSSGRYQVMNMHRLMTDAEMQDEQSAAR